MVNNYDIFLLIGRHTIFLYNLIVESQEQLMDIYERLDDISADTAEARAANILHGLGFTKAMQNQKTKDFSGNKIYFEIYIIVIVLTTFKNLYIFFNYSRTINCYYKLIFFMHYRWLENENCFSSSFICHTTFAVTR